MLPALLLVGPLKQQLTKLSGPEKGPEGLMGDLTKMLPKIAPLDKLRERLPKLL